MAEPFLEVNLKFLTPIWTGNLYKEKVLWEIKASSIIGTLRFWYEALLRGIVLSSIDPASSEKIPMPACSPYEGWLTINDKIKNIINFKGKKILKQVLKDKLDEDKLDEDYIKRILKSSTQHKCTEKGYCYACQLFGCTGIGRKFVLRLENNLEKIDSGSVRTRKFLKHKNSYGYRPIEGFCSRDNSKTLKLSFFEKLTPLTALERKLLEYTVYLISNYGCWGGRTSQGNGLSEILNPKKNICFPVTIKQDELDEIKKKSLEVASENKDYLPAIDTNFFCNNYSIKFQEDIDIILNSSNFWMCNDSWKKNWEYYNFLPLGFHIRDALRQSELFYPSRNDKNEPDNKDKRHKLFGYFRQEIPTSKVRVSHIFKDEYFLKFRIYGFDVTDDDISEFNSVEHIKNDFQKNFYNTNFIKIEELRTEPQIKGNKLYELV